MAKSAGNVFPAEFAQKSAGKTKNSSNSWTCYKESWSWAWALAQASWRVAPPLGVWQHDRVEIIANDQSNRTTPSYVAFTDTERLIDDAAKNRVAMNPTNIVFRKYSQINFLILDFPKFFYYLSICFLDIIVY